MPRLLICLVVLLVVGSGWLIYRNLEFYNELINKGWSVEALRNPYLAAEQYLQTRVHRVTSAPKVERDEDFSGYSVMLVSEASHLNFDRQKSRLLQWVQEGGVLIIGADEGDPDTLVSDLGFSTTFGDVQDDEHEEAFIDNRVEVRGHGDEETPQQEKDKDRTEDKEKSLAERLREENERIRKRRAEQKQNPADAGPDVPRCATVLNQCEPRSEPEITERQTTVLTFDGIDAELKAHFWGSQVLDHPEISEEEPETNELVYWTGDGRGVHFAQLEYGQGLITVMSSTNIWNNYRIGHFDHAYLLDIFVHEDSDVLILYGKDMPSLGTLIYRYFFEALVASAMLIISALFYFGRRFGPVQGASDAVRRSRHQNFSALAQYRWKIKDDEGLVAHMREDIQRRAHRRWPDFPNLNRAEQTRNLASLGVLPAITIDSAMNSKINFQETQYLNLVKALQILRKSL
ncbi:hypothetical protein HBA55_18775 [Pseudomaricurvus alkylphenolicus]|uniref:DUF4350 domain-containing protein n=1 Tax=Pseudomaricurvus alkylphenolicus TaxID=1306991 RepID=UPI00141D8C06|nr:DUF4350 domain-containing protein [Pseudomaricurvus alkylphenolicus]NIB41656.1 hypothetical protein [Pseudomaricurvus alkylphenolicus]